MGDDEGSNASDYDEVKHRRPRIQKSRLFLCLDLNTESRQSVFKGRKRNGKCQNR